MKYYTSYLPFVATFIICSVTAVERPYLRLSDDAERDALEPLKFCLNINRKADVNQTAVFSDMHLQSCNVDCDGKCKGKKLKPKRNLMKDLQWFPWDNKVMGLGTHTYGRCLQRTENEDTQGAGVDAAECDRSCGQHFCWDTDGFIKFDNEGDFSECLVAAKDDEMYDQGKFKALALIVAKCDDYEAKYKSFTYETKEGLTMTAGDPNFETFNEKFKCKKPVVEVKPAIDEEEADKPEKCEKSKSIHWVDTEAASKLSTGMLFATATAVVLNYL